MGVADDDVRDIARLNAGVTGVKGMPHLLGVPGVTRVPGSSGMPGMQ